MICFGSLRSLFLASIPRLSFLTLYMLFFFIPAEQDHPGPFDIQWGSFQALFGGALGEHHQWGCANGWLIMHTRWPPWTHCGWMQRCSSGPARPVERVHEQCKCKSPLCTFWKQTNKPLIHAVTLSFLYILFTFLNVNYINIYSICIHNVFVFMWETHIYFSTVQYFLTFLSCAVGVAYPFLRLLLGFAGFFFICFRS